MPERISTYNPKEVTVSLGTHIVSGYAEDSFVNIEPNGDGIMKKVGCDGEIVRAISPDNTFKITLSLLQTSKSNAYLNGLCDKDRKDGSGMVPVLIKDLKGGQVFSSEAAWPVRKAPLQRGKDSNTRQWEIQTGDAKLTE